MCVRVCSSLSGWPGCRASAVVGTQTTAVLPEIARAPSRAAARAWHTRQRLSLSHAASLWGKESKGMLSAPLSAARSIARHACILDSCAAVRDRQSRAERERRGEMQKKRHTCEEEARRARAPWRRLVLWPRAF